MLERVRARPVPAVLRPVPYHRPGMSAVEPRDAVPAIDYQRLYSFRFRNIDQGARQGVWNEIARQVYPWMGSPERVLDPAAGRGEFVNAIPATERWVIDTVEHEQTFLDDGVKVLIGDARTMPLPDDYFDGVFVSNLLEHFVSQEAIGAFLVRLRHSMVSGGRIAVLGPNFRYCAREYFDCADHTLGLTHRSVEEHLYTAGFEIERVIPGIFPTRSAAISRGHPGWCGRT